MTPPEVAPPPAAPSDGHAQEGPPHEGPVQHADAPRIDEPGVSEPGASELGASELGASEPGASEPSASEPWGGLGFAPSGINASAGFFTWALTSGEVVCDRQTMRMHGLAPDADPRFETFLSQVPPEDVEALLCALDPLLTRVGDYLIEYRVRWPDGSLHTLETRGRVIGDASGRAERSMGVIVDVTERRAQERAVRTEARAASRIHELTAGLAAASTLGEVDAAVRRALPALGADALIVADAGSPVQVLLACGAAQRTPGPLKVAPDGPVRTAMAHDAPLFFSDAATLCKEFPGMAEPAERLGFEGWAFLPASGVPRMRGICLLGYERPVDFDEPERTMLVLAASAIGQAVSRATVHDTERSIALALQEGMLPRSLKIGPSVSAARRYEAATSGIQVGGDWYDSVRLDDGSTILIIGDVEGHNVHAAGMMYRLRTTVRAYAAEKHPVDEVLRRANEFVAGLGDDVEQPLFATCLVARVDPAEHAVTAGRAGHIPPFVVPPQGAAYVPTSEVGVPLGVDPDARYPVWRMPYEPGTRILLCTDGLLESISNDLDLGKERTLAALDAAHGMDLERMADQVLDANRPVGVWQDDVALLLAELN